MKNIILPAIFLIIFTASKAEKVPDEDARKVAINFYYEHAYPIKHLESDQVRIIEAFSLDEYGVPLYYVYNTSDGGFIAVAATDQSYPVLCYSFTSSYSEENQVPAFVEWMKQYTRQIHYAISNRVAPEQKTIDAWKLYLKTGENECRTYNGRMVEPLLMSTWNQGLYYNQMCPADPAGPGGYCYAGCVATAMGQVMNYFRFPETGTGSYSYECPPYGILSVDFDSATYDWGYMEPSLSHSNEYVAELLFHLGVSVDMVYGPQGSGMYNHKAAYSLKTYFKYSPETQYVYRDSTSMDWDSLLVSHLDRGIPMYYAGWSVPDINGHAFVCDGYQEIGYYHFNWGWGGDFDGYFYTNNLTPGGSNFNLAQELIINAVPDTNNYVYPTYCQGDTIYTGLNGTIDDGSGPLYAYQDFADCSWLIAPDDSVTNISLEFLEFDLSPGDTVYIYDGDSINAPLLGSFSGTDIPSPVTSSGARLLIRFDSNDDLKAGGFLAAYSSEAPVYCAGSTTHTAQTDTITDGSGPYDYQNNTFCTWSITPEGAGEVTIYFEDFKTEPVNDFLRIYDLEGMQILAEYSGNYPMGIPDPVTSPSGKMKLVFITNYAIRDSGWTAYYDTDLVTVKDFSLAKENIAVYPNPASGDFNIQINVEKPVTYGIRLMDITGKTEYFEQWAVNSGTYDKKISLSGISPGIYILQITSNEQAWIVKKIVKY